MVKGLNDKQSGFWMYLQKSIRPTLEMQCHRRLTGAELGEIGHTFWAALSDEDKQLWKDRAKNFNLSTAGMKDKMHRRAEYRERRHQYAEAARSVTNLSPGMMARETKPSSVLPLSRRFDEIDRCSRVYFSTEDDYNGKRSQDVLDEVRHLQWRYADPQDRLEQFLYKELCLVSVNVFYELDDRVYPSEISILKFSIDKGITSQKTFVLGLTEPFFTRECEVEAAGHETRTGLSADPRKMVKWARTDFGGIWDEIKNFTGVAESRTRLLCFADFWNDVVGSFSTLFDKVNEKTFCRVDTRFLTIEDYFLTMAKTVYNWMEIAENFKNHVDLGFRWEWPTAIDYDMVTCPFHSYMRHKQPRQAKCCSLKRAHEAAFNLFLLCRDLIFPHYEFNSSHFPETLPIEYMKPGVEIESIEVNLQNLPTPLSILRNANSVGPVLEPVGTALVDRGPARNLQYEDRYLTQICSQNSDLNSMRAPECYKEQTRGFQQPGRMFETMQFAPNLDAGFQSLTHDFTSFNIHDGQENRFPADRFAEINRNRVIEFVGVQQNEIPRNYHLSSERDVVSGNHKPEICQASASSVMLSRPQHDEISRPSNRWNQYTQRFEEASLSTAEDPFERSRNLVPKFEPNADRYLLNRQNPYQKFFGDVTSAASEERFEQRKNPVPPCERNLISYPLENSSVPYRSDRTNLYSIGPDEIVPPLSNGQLNRNKEPLTNKHDRNAYRLSRTNPYQDPPELASVSTINRFEQQRNRVLSPEPTLAADVIDNLSRRHEVYSNKQRNFDYDQEYPRLGAVALRGTAKPQQSFNEMLCEDAVVSKNRIPTTYDESRIRRRPLGEPHMNALERPVMRFYAPPFSGDFGDSRFKKKVDLCEKTGSPSILQHKNGLSTSRSFSSVEVGGFSSGISGTTSNNLEGHRVADNRHGVGRSEIHRHSSFSKKGEENVTFNVNDYQITYKVPKLEVYPSHYDVPDRRLEAALDYWCSAGFDDPHYPL